MTPLHYTLPKNDETEFEPGSNGEVLKNSMGIKTREERDRAEATGLKEAYRTLFSHFERDHSFTAQDIKRIHFEIFTGIYSWAGRYRSVNIEGWGRTFAVPAFIHANMQSFEDSFLSKLTPLRQAEIQETALHLAMIHGELVVIHPFRDGNGRTTRLLMDILINQAGLPEIDLRPINSDGPAREAYFSAVSRTWHRDYKPLADLLLKLIRNIG